MIVKTRFSIGDKVWYISNNQVHSGTVCGVYVFSSKKDGMKINYSLGYPGDGPSVSDDNAYASKKELINSLI